MSQKATENSVDYTLIPKIKWLHNNPIYCSSLDLFNSSGECELQFYDHHSWWGFVWEIETLKCNKNPVASTRWSLYEYINIIIWKFMFRANGVKPEWGQVFIALN